MGQIGSRSVAIAATMLPAQTPGPKQLIIRLWHLSKSSPKVASFNQCCLDSAKLGRSVKFSSLLSRLFF